nr:hypothetical protein CFP56_23296 [Quercus suber]
MDDSAFLSGLVDVQVMDEDLTTCKRVSFEKHVVGIEVSCLLVDSKGDRAECSDPVKSRPKRGETKMKKGLTSLQGPPILNSGCATIIKPTLKATVSCVAEEKHKGNIHQLDGLKKGFVVEEKGKSNCFVLDGLKKGTWKRAYNKSQPGMLLPLKSALGPKRRSMELFSVAEKIECAKKKNHSPLVLHLVAKPRKKRVGRVFRFESMWLKDPRCGAIVGEAWDDGLFGGSGDVLNNAWRVVVLDLRCGME